MTPTEIRNAVCTLQAKGHSLREISRSLALSRNTVRRILRQPNRTVDEAAPCDEATLARLKAAFERARGHVVRVQGLLADDGLEVRYSTLTRWAREAGLRSPPRRSGEYDFAPGQEMQHDTSPHRVTFGPLGGQAGKPVTLHCAGLVLAYSRRLFIQYYPRFTRFEARAFLLEAARFMAGVCPVCIIDNTSVLLAAGAGAEAVIAPEIAAFARTLGFGFRAHRVGNPDRKGRIERPFAYVETNFLVGRNFADLDDLNRQALAWCRDTANRKPKQALGMSPDAAYVIEQSHLVPLPDVPPPVYELFERVVDPRVIDQRDTRNTLPGHHTIPVRRVRGTAAEEALLLGHHDSLDRYTAALRQHGRAGNRRALRRMIEMRRTYPPGPFIAAIEQALRYGLFDLTRLEDLILRQVAGDFFALKAGENDDA